MRRRIAPGLAATITVIGLVGCTHADETGAALPALGTPVTAPEPTGAPITNAQVLHAALQTTAELPVGFVPSFEPQLPPGDEPTGSDRSSTDPPQCAAVLATVAAQAPGAVSDAAARFSGPDFASIDLDAASYAGTGAANAFGILQDTFHACTEYRGTDADGYRVDTRLGALDQPAVGDASVAVRLTTTSDGVTLTSDVVVSMVDATVIQIVASGRQPIAPDALAAVSRAAVDRVHHAI